MLSPRSTAELPRLPAHPASAVATFRVRGIRCSACVRPWQQQLLQLEGVDRVAIDVASATATVHFASEKLNVDAVRRALLQCPGCSMADPLAVQPERTRKETGPPVADEGTDVPAEPCRESRRSACCGQVCPQTPADAAKALPASTATLVLIVRERWAPDAARPRKTLWTALTCSRGTPSALETATQSLLRALQQRAGVWSAARSRSSPGTGWGRLFPTEEARVVTVLYDPHTVGARTLLRIGRQSVDAAAVAVAPGSLPPETALEDEARQLQQQLCVSGPAAFLVGWLTFAPARLVPACLQTTVVPGILRVDLLVALLSFFVYAVGGFRFHRRALQAICSRYLTMDVLVSLSTTLTLLYSVVSVAATSGLTEPSDQAQAASRNSAHHRSESHFFEMPPFVITAILLGQVLEVRARRLSVVLTRPDDDDPMKPCVALVSAREAARAQRASGGPACRRTVPACLVEVNDCLQVHVGDTVLCDGVLEAPGSVCVDESLVTGEARLVVKERRSDALVGGSRIVSAGGADGTVVYRVTQMGSATCLGRLQHLVHMVRVEKPTIQRFADALAQWFIPAVLSFAGATGLVWTLLFATGAVGPPTPARWSAALFTAKSVAAVLAIACPCALGLASSTAVALGIARAASTGAFVRNVNVMEAAAHSVTDVVFDKTGTLTSEDVRLTRILARPASDWPAPLDQLPFEHGTPSAETFLLWCAASLQQRDNQHPIARAIRAEWNRVAAGDEQLLPLATPAEPALYHGEGVLGHLDLAPWGSGGRPPSTALRRVAVAVGNLRCMRRAQVAEAEPGGCADDDSSVFIACNGTRIGSLRFSDCLREEATGVIQHLQQSYGVRVWMCTGDTWPRALRVASHVGIPTGCVQAELTPEAKAEFVRSLTDARRGVMMVGDGVNDAAPVAAATIGIAMGVRAHMTLTAADVVLLHSNLNALVSFLELTKAVGATIKRNFAWAFAFNGLALPAAAGLFLPVFQLSPTWAGCSMAASSAAVALNSALLLRLPPHPESPRTAGLLDKLTCCRRPPRGRYRPVLRDGLDTDLP